MTEDYCTLFDGYPVARGHETGCPHVVLSSQVRILRNLDGRLFPGRASKAELSEVRGILWQAAETLKEFENGWAFVAEKTGSIEAAALAQAGYVDEDWSSKPMAGARISSIRDTALVANGDDHLSLNVFRPGIAIREAMTAGETLTRALAREVAYTRHPQIGYLTANLCDAGWGVRIGTVLHVPVLRMSGRIRAIARGLQALGFSITNSTGTMGTLEDDVLKLWLPCDLQEDLDESVFRLENETKRLRDFELETREQMLSVAPEDLFDRVGRCYGLLCQARRLSMLDVQRFFSGLRLGVDLGMFANVDHKTVDRLEHECSDVHLQREPDVGANARSLEIARATHVKRALELLR